MTKSTTCWAVFSNQSARRLHQVILLVSIIVDLGRELCSHSIARRGRPSSSRGRGRPRGGSSGLPPLPNDRSFAHESAIFGVAGVETSSFVGDSEFDITSQHPAAKEPVLESVELQAQRPILTEIARNTRVEQPPQDVASSAAVPQSLLRFLSNVTYFLMDFVWQIGKLLSAGFSHIVSMFDW